MLEVHGVIERFGNDILFVIKKSASALLTPDKHKMILPERRSLPFWENWLVTSRGQALELDSDQSRKFILSSAV
jgi:hypothetical protein